MRRENDSSIIIMGDNKPCQLTTLGLFIANEDHSLFRLEDDIVCLTVEDRINGLVRWQDLPVIIS